MDSESNELLQLPHVTHDKLKELKNHGIKSLNSLIHMKKEALFSISKKIIKTERNQTEFLKAVNDLPVLCLGSKLSISVIGGKTDIAEYTRINNIYSSDSDSNNDIRCTEDSQTDPTSTNITANPDGDRIGRSQAAASKSSSLTTSKILGTFSQNTFTKIASLTPGTEYDLKFSIDLLHGNSKASVFCPRYHRSKVASYWCVVGIKGSVLAVKKVIFSGTRMNVVIPVMIPGTATATASVAAMDVNRLNTKISNPNDKLYMNYDDDYRQLQQQQQQVKEKDKKERQSKRQEIIQIYLISDSIMGLDDAVDLPILS